jgi:hypothetical protein
MAILPQSEALQVKAVEGKRDLLRFIRLLWSIYADDPVWVPPLLLERRLHFSSANPYFDHAQYRSWMAYRGSRPVGRISAQVDQLHLQRYQDATGFFGLLEAEDCAETFEALTGAAETWLRRRGMRRILGPFNLSINQECGLLVEGFDTPPSIMMGHALPYYGPRLEEGGYRKEMDLLAYHIDIDHELSGPMKSVITRAQKRVRVRSLRRSQYRRELQILQDIFEDAWSQNWGFIPFTEAEFSQLGQSLRFLVYDDYVQIAEVDGEPAAMIVMLPNLNEVIRDMNGRLLPWGWLKLLWGLKVSRPKTARVILMGVRRRYQNSLLGGVLAMMVVETVRAAGKRRGVQGVELSWILEDNMNMRDMIEARGSRKPYKRYRIYGKELV